MTILEIVGGAIVAVGILTVYACVRVAGLSDEKDEMLRLQDKLPKRTNNENA